MKQTEVEWLVEQMLVCNYISKKQFENANTWLVQEAKKMEKEQQDEFAIGFVEWIPNNAYKETTCWRMYDKADNEYTTEELLEIYKKEKGL